MSFNYLNCRWHFRILQLAADRTQPERKHLPQVGLHRARQASHHHDPLGKRQDGHSLNRLDLIFFN